MRSFRCKVEVVGHEGMVDPTSAQKMRELQNVGGDVASRISRLRISDLISFTVSRQTAEEAEAMVADMSGRLLVNPVLAEPNITVEELGTADIQKLD